MHRVLAVVALLVVFAAGCGESNNNTLPTVNADDLAAGSCLVGDPNCTDGADAGAADELPSVIALTDPSDPGAPLPISFSGFFYSDGQVSQLCSALAESFPPQCGSVVIEIDASIDVALEHVAESFGDPDNARINIDQGVYWTDDWINLSGVLVNNRLVLD